MSQAVGRARYTLCWWGPTSLRCTVHTSFSCEVLCIAISNSIRGGLAIYSVHVHVPCKHHPYTGCLPDTAVCLHASTGQWFSIGMASTQQVIVTGEISLIFATMQFSKDQGKHQKLYNYCSHICMSDSPADNHLQIKFTGRQKCKDASSHVTIDMTCGLAGLSLALWVYQQLTTVEFYAVV